MYKSTDAGNFVWSARSAPAAIADFVVQDASTLYVAEQGFGLVAKSTSGAFIWLPPAVTNGVGGAGGTSFSLKLIAPDNLVWGGNAGGASYSANGGTSFTYLGAAGAGNTLVDATGLAAGNTVFAVTTGAAGFTWYWTIGASVLFLPGTATAGATGISYANGVLYVQDSGTPDLDRYLTPTVLPFAATDLVVDPATYTQANMINSLQAVIAGSTTLYARNADAGFITPDTIDNFTDYLATAADVPVPTYPINDAIIPINSISGAINAFTFQWNAPPSLATSLITNPVLTYNYNIVVYLDEAATVPLAGSLGAGFGNAILAAASAAPNLAVGSNFPNNGATTSVGALVPGTTYYWRVRVDALPQAQRYRATGHRCSPS